MAARYVYWRKSDGSPCRDSSDTRVPRRLLAEIGKSAFINPEGKVAWRGWSLLQVEPAILGSIVVLDPDREELNRADSASICRDAMRSLIRKTGGAVPLDPAAFMRVANTVAAAHFRKPSADYVLVTTVSVRSLPAKRITVNHCRIESIRDRSRYTLPDIVRAGQRSGMTRGAGPLTLIHISGPTSPARISYARFCSTENISIKTT